MDNQTIYALSTVYGKSGVAVIRISGSEVIKIISEITSLDVNNIKPRYAYFTDLKDNVTRETIDKCLILYFKSPYSFTGEDVLEIQCHGSKAVLNSVFKTLSSFDNVRLAEPGEFSKRAFYNGKMDLTEAEGLADLIDAETSEQQKYAIRQMEGNLKNLYTSWRENLVKVLSYLEAYIDFPEEEIPENLYNDILNTVFKTKEEIKKHLQNNNVSERLKNGFRVVIAGAANAGKSSLINALTQKNTMIVSDIAGTTRDAVDINLDIKGYPVIITDTAGIRITDNPIEKIGIDMALEKINNADIVIALYDATTGSFDNKLLPNTPINTIYVANKIDKLTKENIYYLTKQNHILISAKYGKGINLLIEKIIEIIKSNFNSSSNALITRERYRAALINCLENLDRFNLNKEIELSTEDIRMACRAIGQITGKVKVDEILDNIFGSFCIGK
ncbi:MAG: tRNA uridine-5-carboxymethylaminomethyl(34) synthesis GTPase MnmE [Alphaproteobacteria bacterium]|nr:tRNA uridine-5-carboxymethylaminomethyl(34) synthesis GTPase MnmE [Alphaproteobacteria bacterium]